MAQFVSSARVALGTRAFRVEFVPGVATDVPDDRVDEILDARGGFGRNWLALGVLKRIEPAEPPPRMEPTESQITRAVAADEAVVLDPEPTESPRQGRRRR